MVEEEKTSRSIMDEDTKEEKFYITESNGEKEVSKEDYLEFNVSEEDKEEVNLKEFMKQVKEELSDDVVKFVTDVGRFDNAVRDMTRNGGGSNSGLIDSQSLTNYLLWRLLKKRI